MNFSKEYMQNCNVLLVGFMIVFLVLGILASQKSGTEKQIEVLDQQLDRYEESLNRQQKQMEEDDTDYLEKYAEYEENYNEYMKVYEERKALYEKYKRDATEGFHLNPLVLWVGIGVLFIAMIGINIYAKKKN